MKLFNHIYLLLAILAGLLFPACGDGDFIDGPEGDLADCFNLNVSVPMVSSRAVADNLNEFTVNTLHLYFFRAENHDDATSEYVHDVIVDGSFEFSRRLRLALPDNALLAGGLFGTDASTCIVYAVANVDESLLTPRTVDGLKSVSISSGFDKTEPQPKFAMDGFATLTLDRATRSVSGTITLERAAAKLTLAVDLPSSIEVEQTIISPIDGTQQTVIMEYFSRATEMRIWISNGVKESVLNANPHPSDETSLYSNDIVTADGEGSPFTYDTSQPKYHYLQEIPFYSYPSKWNPYSPTGNCFLTLVIPWYYIDANGATQNVVTYYRLSVQPNKNFIERNTHYDMRVTIGRLGGTMIQQPIDMLFDWNYNMQWNVQTLPTDIKEIRYLLLNNNDFSPALDAYTYTLENETSISIPYNSSHPVEIESVELTWRDYYSNADRKLTLSHQSGTYRYNDFNSYNPVSDYAGIEIDQNSSVLKLKRDMRHLNWNNGNVRITTDPAINAYTFTVKLRHTDAVAGDPTTHATVVITQIPAINITTQRTVSGTRFINKNNETYQERVGGSWWNPQYGDPKGYLGNSAPSNTTQRRYWLGSYHEQSSGYINNPRTYILTISKFDNNDKYIIADPRTRTVDNLNESGTAATADGAWSMTAQNMTDNANNVLLRNYYPADGNADKANFIAPKLRVASQWGVTYQMYRRGAERRCASYQEDGRPAGRWRLPTPAEIEYICRLSNKKYIPYLFGTEGETANYWCSAGGVNVNNNINNPSVTIVNTSDTETRAVRCVYDEWFWDTDTLTAKGTFTWGDRPRTINGN